MQREAVLSTWKISVRQLDLDKESIYEALFTLGNGYFGTRGAMLESKGSKVHYPGTYIAGVYNKLDTLIAGKTVTNEDLVNCPNWLFQTYKINGGQWFDRQKVKILKYNRELDMKKGILKRVLRWQDDQGKITELVNQRIVSMADPHYGAQRYSIVPKNYSGKFTLRSGIDGSVINANVERYRQLNSKHLEPRAYGSFEDGAIYLQMRTNQSRIEISEAIKINLFCQNELVPVERKTVSQGKEKIFQEFTFEVKQGQEVVLEKLMSVYTSRDQGVTDNVVAAQEALKKINRFQDIYSPHVTKWQALWKHFDIEVQGDPYLQRLLRFNIFHLLQTASTYNDDNDAGLPARGLHGEAYRGHIFWDELYSLPFYTLHAPEITRGLLMYRYRRLNPAREYAHQHQYEGAMYPWQSGSSGYEESQVLHLNPLSKEWGPDFSALQRHVSIAIAYNIINYYRITLDEDFMDRYGAEVVLEIARFWNSITVYNPGRDRFEIHGVMGPDEFHEKLPGQEEGGLSNNAYTNVMVVWVLTKAMDLLKRMEEQESLALKTKIGLSNEELNRWENITHKMFIPMDDDGLIHQFEGYMELKELDWDEYRDKYVDIHRMDRILKSEGQSPDDYKVSKQADVLMIFYMLPLDEVVTLFKNLGYNFKKEYLKKNYEYYLERTSHGSTLSFVVHAHVAHLVGEKEAALEFFRQGLKADFEDVQGGTTAEGIHVGAMGGSIGLFYQIIGGMRILEDRICFAPQLPEFLKQVDFFILYNYRWLEINLTQDSLTLLVHKRRAKSLRPPSTLPILIKDQVVMFTEGVRQTISLK